MSSVKLSLCLSWKLDNTFNGFNQDSVDSPDQAELNGPVLGQHVLVLHEGVLEGSDDHEVQGLLPRVEELGDGKVSKLSNEVDCPTSQVISSWFDNISSGSFCPTFPSLIFQRL